MARQDGLFSIGDISRFTGASIRSLRYYEEHNILEPVYIDPSSNYRYYSFEQCYLINIIMLCIELDIPLKELSKYIHKNKTIDLSVLLANGKDRLRQKLATLNRGLNFIEAFEQQLALWDTYQAEKGIYKRDIPEKLFHVIPLEHTLENAGILELIKLFLGLEHLEYDPYEFLEFGYMCEHTPAGIQRYAFTELSKHAVKSNMKVIPAGIYLCKQDETNRIEEAPQIFHEHLKGNPSFLVIQTEIYISKTQIYSPKHELRAIALPQASSNGKKQ